ncbi:MAG: hypothetical protein CO119_11010 [Flavobacteriales bacterium CG_4_9_14_3_um_filter_40_17]|nr:MAG: hypothetical protein CO119_11010 [Flavobacteriales bacterium CG_4_9_14_3_um_filter_40_17]
MAHILFFCKDKLIFEECYFFLERSGLKGLQPQSAGDMRPFSKKLHRCPVKIINWEFHFQ